MKRVGITGGLVALILTAATPAWAHVTVSTDNPEPGGFAVYTVRVPSESESASTVSIEVQIPDGLDASRYQPRPGWSLRIEDGVFTIDGGAIGPGEFDEFRFQARNPENGGDLSFAAIQTYDDGEVASWTGEPGSDHPASVVQIEASGADDVGADTGVLTWVALAAGVVGTVVGGFALVRSRR